MPRLPRRSRPAQRELLSRFTPIMPRLSTALLSAFTPIMPRLSTAALSRLHADHAPVAVDAAVPARSARPEGA
ncbi:hypothetical protein ACIPPS_24700 [Streptomyces sp. NPDC090127]|uniref:hypothetical protein n=1 Tax=Streptomyces sp. NPDC090127 TaxID=3365953 RepID=UPI003830B73C